MQDQKNGVDTSPNAQYPGPMVNGFFGPVVDIPNLPDDVKKRINFFNMNGLYMTCSELQKPMKINESTGMQHLFIMSK